MSNLPASDGKWTERSSALASVVGQHESMFQSLFERSADAIWLFDPSAGMFIDCNQAAVQQLRAGNKEQLLRARPQDLSPALQPDGTPSDRKATEMAVLAGKSGGHRFEWMARRLDGEDVPLEVLATRIPLQGRNVYVMVSRDVSERKRAEREVLELNQTLERRILERTAEVTAREAQLRTLIEHAPEAIVVFCGKTGRFLDCNENATRLYGIGRDQLLQSTAGQLTPEFQPDGSASSSAAAKKIQEALRGGTPGFDWVLRHSDGHLIPCEVRLVRLPGDGPPLIRASILDNSERKRREQVQRATFEISEAVHAAEDLESLYRRIHHIVSGLMPAQNFYIALLDPAREMISFEYYVDERGEKPAPRPMNQGLTSLVLREGKALLIGRALEPRKRQVGKEVLFEGLSASYLECGAPAAVWLGAPLLLHGKTFGAVAVQDYENEEAYGEEEKRILTFVAGQIALAIERKRSEQAMRESEAKFRALFEASSQGIILHDEHQMLEVNPACLRILGFRAPEEIIGKHPAETSAPIQPNGERADLLARQFIQECLTRGSARFDWLARNSRGEEIPIEIVLTRIEWGGRQLIQAVFNDITERKRAETELRASADRLRESEARFSTAFRSSPISIALARLSDRKYVEVNDAFLQWTKYSRQEVLGHTAAELGLWESAEERDAFWKELQREGFIREKECRVRDRHGISFTGLLSMDIIEVNHDPHVLLVGIDITHRKRAEAELLRAVAREKELGQLKSNFVSMVSHEFRTPLGIIQSSAEILSDYHDRLSEEERKEQLVSIVKNTRRMAGMMEEVLVLSRLDAHKMDFRPGSLDLDAFCRRVVGEIRSATENRCAIDLSVVPTSQPAWADERLLGHVFTNLLSNAVKYSEAGSRVHFTVGREGTEAVCVVRDDGIGIPESDQQWLFTSFQRGRNVGDRPGTGLGLVLVKRCLELHGGTIQIRSRVGHGTEATVRLPVYGTQL
jgi:PAS domain S-box-containing protein